MKFFFRSFLYLFFIFSITIFSLFLMLNKTYAQNQPVNTIEEDQEALMEIVGSMKCFILDVCDDQTYPQPSGLPNPSDQPRPNPETTPGGSITPGATMPPLPPQPSLPPPDDENRTTVTCPVISGKIICGSYDTAAPDKTVKCQHCRPGYPEPSACQYPGTRYAVDVSGGSGGNIFFPHINNKVLEWVHLPQYEVKYSDNAIQKYIGTVLPNRDKKYWLQLHHTNIGSGKSGKSGDLAATICSSCFSSGVHTHIQIGSDTMINGSRSWYDAGKIINCR